MMLKWLDIIKLTSNNKPIPDYEIEKNDAERKQRLAEEQFKVGSKKEIQTAQHSDICSPFQSVKYICIGCKVPLFDEDQELKNISNTYSFTQPIKDNTIGYYKVNSDVQYHIEAFCTNCNTPLGYVFQDDATLSGLRFDINSYSLQKMVIEERKLTMGGGCFWCTEAIFQQLKGVLQVESGYSGGKITNPTYREVSSGLTGHAEVIEITYLVAKINFSDLIRIHLTTHNPTKIIKKGKQNGTQYRSIIFYRNEYEKEKITEIINELQNNYSSPIITELMPFEYFYKAEERHQNYYSRNPEASYCQTVIDPKLAQFKVLYKEKLNN
ncbi:peptide-methionine (S)-S-oxide reductase MsrA [Flavobacterium sp. NG2]|uniref:peptide-methionine (S)-S-oxide reductase MsrA n=1 Tax=Flavobacterium sp. NG2 TaxID=3097547 RepID=UPI002A83EA48|nr:peptide-methionine (S)-S-oxide reductase MsrA [Flavobacterium sp. NG2]WPR70669.1 peptide-methionine (S)-S-oxide reductase MsrA [Flavobacterium sp. NG2]